MGRVLTIFGLGFVGALGCWYGCSGEGYWQHQLRWVVGSIAACGVMVIAAVGWILQGFRAVRRERALVDLGVMALIEHRSGRATHIDGADARSDATARSLLTVAGMTRYHRPGCRLLAGKEPIALTGATIARKQLSPCGMCRP